MSWLSLEWFDHRYFWRDETTCRCHCTCGLAREGGAITVRKAKPVQFLDVIWFNSLDVFEGNPVVVGFIVEQTCLSVLSSIGFNHEDLHWNSVKPKIFSGDVLYTISVEASETLYIPDRWDYKDIDAFYVSVDKRKKTVLMVVPIQITINPFHKDSEAFFYADWEQWVKRFQGSTLSSTFVWIVEHKPSWKIVEEQLRSLRGGAQLITPQHKQMYVTAGDLYEPLVSGSRLVIGYYKVVRVCLRSLPSPLTYETEQPSRKMIINESAEQNVHVLLSSKPADTKSASLIRYYSQELEEMIGEDFSEATEEFCKNTLVQAKSRTHLKGKGVKKVKV